jgi:hypothetical protein
MVDENVKKYTWTGCRAINMENKTNEELRKLYEDLDSKKVK